MTPKISKTVYLVRDVNLLIDKIHDTKGKFYSIVFTKADGSDRLMIAREGVNKYKKGGKLPYGWLDIRKVHVTFDVKKKAYRSFILSSVKEFRFGGIREIYTR